MSAAEDLERVAEQERRLVFSSFSEDEAFSIGLEFRQRAAAEAKGIVVDLRLWDRPLFYAAMSGTSADNPEWVRRKVNVVRRFLKSSYAVGLDLAARGRTLDAERGIDLMDYAPHGGSFPIRLENAGVIGTITVSGLTQREDHELVVAVLCHHLGLDHAELALPEE